MKDVMVLCIENEPTLLATRKLVLQSAGFGVLTAGSAREALEVFSRERVDVVVLDYQLPEMNGSALALHMKQLKPRVPILMLSAQMFLPEGALDAVDAFITKGEGPQKMLKAITLLLQ